MITARTRVGSFLDKLEKQGKSTDNANAILPEFFSYIGDTHGNFKNIPRKFISTADKGTMQLYDILRKTVDARKEKPKASKPKYEPNPYDDLVDPRNPVLERRTPVGDTVGMPTRQSAKERAADKAPAEKKKDPSDDQDDPADHEEDDGDFIVSFNDSNAVYVQPHQESGPGSPGQSLP